MNNLLKLLKGEAKLVDVFHYFLGHYRYKLYFLKSTWMRKHIRQQIDQRLQWMNQECYNRGSCIKCGCEVPALQMSNKSCDANCYPPMMNKKHWDAFRNGSAIKYTNGNIWIIDKETAKPILYKENNFRYVRAN